MSITLSAAERAYRWVKDRILSGSLAGGELISEGEVAASLEMSRTPVREAFLRLEAEGWMKLYPKRGALIVPVPPDEAENVIGARFVVETGAVRVLAGTDRSGVVRELRAGIERHVANAAAGDVDAFTKEDATFHRILVQGAGNPVLSAFYDTLRDRQLRMTSASVQRDHAQMQRIIKHHTELTDLIETGDVEGFSKTLSVHLTAVHGLRRPPVMLRL